MPKDIVNRRMQMIDEAIGWNGSVESPGRHYIRTCSDGSELLFEKPGKEALEGKNENDMKPMIIVNGSPLAPPSFSFIFSELTNIAMVDFEAFRAILLLIYRNAYLLDHKEISKGVWRYEPKQVIRDCIAELDRQVGSRTTFGSVDGLLGFIDLLGWNEDVKYHSFEGKASFSKGRYGGKDKKIGRIRTALTCIRIHYDVSRFMYEHRREFEKGEKADFVQLYDIMQSLINSRGLCVPRTKADLIEYLHPYVLDGTSKKAGYSSATTPPIQHTIV